MSRVKDAQVVDRPQAKSRTVAATMKIIRDRYGYDMDGAFSDYIRSIGDQPVPPAAPPHTDETRETLRVDYWRGYRAILSALQRNGHRRLTFLELLAKIVAGQAVLGATYRVTLPDGRHVTAKRGSGLTTATYVSFRLLPAENLSGAGFDRYPVVSK